MADQIRQTSGPNTTSAESGRAQTVETPRSTIVRPVGGYESGYDTSLSEHPERSALSWRSVFAGTFIALLTYVFLMSLGLAIGGANLRGAIQGEDTSGLGIGTAIWSLISVLVALYTGGYTAARVSGFITTRVGRIQGLVITSLFFFTLLTQIGSVIGGIAGGLGNLAGAAGSAAGNLASNPTVQNVVNESLQGLDLKSPPQEIVTGLTTRLVRGDTEGAVTYLSSETGIPRQEAQRRIDEISDRFQATVRDAGTQVARGLQIAGWTLFGSILLGSIFGMLGGGLGAQANLRQPLSGPDRRALDRRRVA